MLTASIFVWMTSLTLRGQNYFLAFTVMSKQIIGFQYDLSLYSVQKIDYQNDPDFLITLPESSIMSSVVPEGPQLVEC